MLGEALGGKVEKAKTGWSVGVNTFEVLKKEDWMEPFQADYNLMMMCQDQVVELPENSTVLAKTANCPVGMFRVGENMLGIQAHPEFPKAYELALLDSRWDRITAEKISAAKESLALPVHDQVVAQWMLQFLAK